MGLSELTALVDMLRERGVFFYRQGDLELHLAPGVEPPRKEEKSEPDKPGWRGYGREERDALGIGDS